MTTYNFQHTICYLFILLLISCHSKEEVCSHPKETVCSHLKEAVLPSPEEEVQLGQTGMNINAYEIYLSLKKDLDSTYTATLNKYKTCEYCFDAADSLRTTQIHQGLITHHTSWQALQELEDDILGNVYYGGTMRGGVMNLNRIDLIKAQLEFYKNFH